MDTKVTISKDLELKLTLVMASEAKGKVNSVTAFSSRDDGREILDFIKINHTFIEVDVSVYFGKGFEDGKVIQAVDSKLKKFKIWSIHKLNKINDPASRWIVILREI